MISSQRSWRQVRENGARLHLGASRRSHVDRCFSPDDLLERLRQGKIYVPQQAPFALEKFFRKNNLVALREMALRRSRSCAR